VAVVSKGQARGHHRHRDSPRLRRFTRKQEIFDHCARISAADGQRMLALQLNGGAHESLKWG